MTTDIRCAQKPETQSGNDFEVHTYHYRPSAYGRSLQIIDVVESSGNTLHLEQSGSSTILSAQLTCKSPKAFNHHDPKGRFFVSVNEVSEAWERVTDTQKACGKEVVDTTGFWDRINNAISNMGIFGGSQTTQNVSITHTGGHFGPLAPLCGIKAEDAAHPKSKENRIR